ncbi:MAG: DsbA family protein, partial [Rhizobiales bacterium]|nr:DsbA family protein [Rhizobacter sp.]
GGDANDPERLAALARELAPRITPGDPAIKQALRDATAEAVARGIFGVPTVEVGGRLFWGVDGLPMLAAFLRGEPWFDGPAWAVEGASRAGVQR